MHGLIHLHQEQLIVKNLELDLDRGLQEGTTEIYMTHRSVDAAPDDGKERVRTPYGVVDTGYKNEAKTQLEDKGRFKRR